MHDSGNDYLCLSNAVFMKKILTLIFAVLCLVLSANGQVKDKSILPQGVMTYNSWSGKISIGGQTIEKELWDQYFTPEDLANFKSGKTLDLVGSIIAIIGAFPTGYGTGYLLGSGGNPQVPGVQAAKTMLFVGLGALITGFAISIPGSVKMRNAIKNYNLSLVSYTPEWRIGATANGFGLAFAF